LLDKYEGCAVGSLLRRVLILNRRRLWHAGSAGVTFLVRPGQAPRPQLQIHSEVIRGGSVAALDALRSSARLPFSDVNVARGGSAIGPGRSVSLQTQVEETPAPVDVCSGGSGGASHVILRHYQQLEVWPVGLGGEHMMRLTRHEYVASPNASDSQATEENTESVAIEFRVYGQARADALVHQWEKILSPEASGRRIKPTRPTTSVGAEPPQSIAGEIFVRF